MIGSDEKPATGASLEEQEAVGKVANTLNVGILAKMA